jgi:hypothetical protein
MPYSTVEGHDECEGQWGAVINDETGEVMGCHDTEESADEQVTALYAAEEEATKTADADKEAREKRAEKYGIDAKEGKAVTKPSKFADVTEADFGDPVNWAYPANKEFASSVAQYFNRDGQREAGGYTSAEWSIIGKRLAERISRHLDADYEYEGGKLTKKEEKADKAGRVLSRTNARRIRDAVVPLLELLESAGIDVPGWGRRIGEPEPMEVAGVKSLSDDLLIAYGGTVKVLSDTNDGLVGGYLVRFSTDIDPDLENQFFTKRTDYDLDNGVGASSVYFHHGLDRTLRKRKLTLPRASLKTDDFGVWVEAQLQLRDAYERFIYERIKEGKMGWSSGTAPNLVEIEPVGKAEWIKTWPLGLDATITPTPAEPRAKVQTLKAFSALTAEEILPSDLESDEGPQSEVVDEEKLAELQERLEILKSYKR